MKPINEIRYSLKELRLHYFHRFFFIILASYSLAYSNLSVKGNTNESIRRNKETTKAPQNKRTTHKKSNQEEEKT